MQVWSACTIEIAPSYREGSAKQMKMTLLTLEKHDDSWTNHIIMTLEIDIDFRLKKTSFLN